MDQFLDSNLDNEKASLSTYASFGQRLAAALIDGIILWVFGLIISFGLGLGMMNDPEAFSEGIPTTLYVYYLITIVAQIAYYAVLESGEKQATFGKQAMGIIVTDTQGNRISMLNAVGRYLAKIPSALILLIGYLMQPFTEKKQALHDMIAGTLVYKK